LVRYSFFIFLLVIALLDGLAHWYLYARLFRDPDWPAWVRRAGAVALVGLAIFLPLGMFLARALDRRWAEPIAYGAYAYMGTLFYLLTILLSVDLVRMLSSGAQSVWAMLMRHPAEDLLEPERRDLLKAGAVGAGVATLGLAGAALRSGLSEVEVKEVEVKLSRLPSALSGLSLVQLTDVHVGPTIGKHFIDRIVEQTNRTRPDAVVITGDLVDGSVERLREHVAPLAKLSARYGVYFVTGNHEYYSGVGPWEEELRRLGIKVLRNERVELGDAAKIDLGGVDDHTSAGMAPGHGPTVDRIIAGRDPERELVLLAHQPRDIVLAEKAGAGLQISGHTHGGQLWPFTGLVGLVQPYVAGLSRHDEHTQIYVSRGTGYWGPPMRLLAPSEITKIVLT
jgi:predicted MPP superfamily phosphohydrolase